MSETYQLQGDKEKAADALARHGWTLIGAHEQGVWKERYWTELEGLLRAYDKASGVDASPEAKLVRQAIEISD